MEGGIEIKVVKHHITAVSVAAMSVTSKDKQPTFSVYTPGNVKIQSAPLKFLRWQYVSSSYRGCVQVAYNHIPQKNR